MSATANVLAGLTVMSCGECGITFAIPTALYDENLKMGPKGPGWYCANGHSRIFRHTADDEAAERKRVKALEGQAEQARLARDRAARTCPWPTCDGRLLASERGLRQHMVKAHGAPWAMPSVSTDEIGQVLNGRDPVDVVR